jgi:DNA-binding XRE family transcriptional regulator
MVIPPVSKQFISEIERGLIPLTRNVSRINKLARVFGLDSSILAGLRPQRKRDGWVPQNDLIAFLAEGRNRLYLTQVPLAEKIEIYSQGVFQVENGKRRPNHVWLQKRQKATGITVPDHLLCHVEPFRKRKTI